MGAGEYPSGWGVGGRPSGNARWSVVQPKYVVFGFGKNGNYEIGNSSFRIKHLSDNYCKKIGFNYIKFRSRVGGRV